MGLLDFLYSTGDSAKRKIRGMLSDPSGYLEQLGYALKEDRKEGDSRRKRMIENPYSITRKDIKAEMDMAMALAPFGMTVWHGSPHKFDKFDMSKIGTGEGAQAYGHGLYMAENPATAKAYQTATSAKNEVQFTNKLDGKLFDLFDVPPADIRSSAQQMMQQEAFSPGYLKQIADNESYQGLVAKNILDGGIVAKEGSMYKVDIPDEAVVRFLDWDKPLSQQSNGALAQARAYIDANIERAGREADAIIAGAKGRKPTAEEISKVNALRAQQAVSRGDLDTAGGLYQRLTADLGSQDAATKYLQDIGIPGIRYLDGGSRSAGQGSSNFVLFDDQMPRILEINGQATGQVPWKHGEWGSLFYKDPFNDTTK